MKRKLIGILLAAASATTLLFSSAVAASDYPSKPVKLIVGFPPGGPTDIISRVIAQNLATELGGVVIVENRAGASGTIGANSVARASPDGYTLLVSVEAAQTRGKVLLPTLPYDQEKDFAFIRKVAKQRVVIVTNPEFPAKDYKELVAYLKANPGKVNTGGTIGASSHVGGVFFDMLHGTKMTYVNYSGGSQPITDLMAGVLQVGFFTESTIAQHVKAGKLKAIAVAAAERSPEFPQIPTVEEAGAKPMDVSPWFGIVAPAGTPTEITDRIGKALDRVTANDEFVSKLKGIGAVPIQGSTSEKFGKAVSEEVKFWNDWVSENKLHLKK